MSLAHEMSDPGFDGESPLGSAYTADYYHRLKEGARKSAEAVVPIVLRLVQPRSVVDVGCGLGTWLRVFQDSGVEDICGVDGDHIDPSILEIPRQRFYAFDLRAPFALSRTFDLVVSLEVAEHLPPASAEAFVEQLTELGPVVLFSAAVPGQGGESHVNEQWQDYWAERFRAREFMAIDALRPAVWQNPSVEWWYAQNMLLYVQRSWLERNPNRLRALAGADQARVSLVHPQLKLQMAWRNRVARASLKLADVIPQHDRFIVVDQDQFGELPLFDRRDWVPFTEQRGAYAGPPAEGRQAIDELERQRAAGAAWIVFGWTAFWWLDYYSDFRGHLDSRYRRVVADDDLLVFDLRALPDTGVPR